MRQFGLLFVAILALATTSTSPRSQIASANRWRPMTFSDLRTPSKTDPLQTIVWPDVIAQENDYVVKQLNRPLNGKNAFVTAISSTYEIADKTVIVSLALSRACDSGANDKSADIAPSTCPLRIVTIQAAKVISRKQFAGCYIDHADRDLPERNRSDSSYTRLNPGKTAVEFRTIIGEADIPACALAIPLN